MLFIVPLLFLFSFSLWQAESWLFSPLGKLLIKWSISEPEVWSLSVEKKSFGGTPRGFQDAAKGRNKFLALTSEWNSPKALTASESVGDVSTLRPDFHWLHWGGRVCPKGRDSGQTHTQKDAAVPSSQQGRALWDSRRDFIGWWKCSTPYFAWQLLSQNSPAWIIKVCAFYYI